MTRAWPVGRSGRPSAPADAAPRRREVPWHPPPRDFARAGAGTREAGHGQRGRVRRRAGRPSRRRGGAYRSRQRTEAWRERAGSIGVHVPVSASCVRALWRSRCRVQPSRSSMSSGEASGLAGSRVFSSKISSARRQESRARPVSGHTSSVGVPAGALRVGEEQRAAGAAGDQRGQRPGGSGLPVNPLRRPALGGDPAALVLRVQVLHVQAQRLLRPCGTFVEKLPERLLPEPDIQAQGGDLVLRKGLGAVRRGRPPLDADGRVAFDPALAPGNRVDAGPGGASQGTPLLSGVAFQAALCTSAPPHRWAGQAAQPTYCRSLAIAGNKQKAGPVLTSDPGGGAPSCPT